MSGRKRERAAVTLGAVIAAILLTWPIAARFGTAGRVDSGDGRYSIWNVAWVAHALTTTPSQLFDANIFHPHTGTLAYSEANLFAGALAVPVWRLTANPLASSNWTILCAFVFAFVATYWLVRRLTGSATGAFVAAMAFAFCPYVFAHLPHVQLLQTFGLPLVLLAMHGFVERRTAGSALTLGGAMALAGLACGYYGVFAGLMAGLGVLWFGFRDARWRQPRYWLLALGAAAVAALIVAPFFVPFMGIRSAGFERSLDEARLFSVGWRSYFASAVLIDRWMLPLIGQWREVLFPGFLTMALALVAVVATWRPVTGGPAGRPGRPVVAFYLVLGALALWASFGPDAGLYTALYEAVPLFALLRAPARFGVLVTLALSVLAGFGAAWLAGRVTEAWRRPLVGALAALSVIGSMVGPLPLVDGPPVNPVYARLAGLPRAPLVEFPYFSARTELHRHTEYMLMSTYHWQPLVNGYSDYTPPDALEATPKLATFPGPDAWQVIGQRRVRYVIIHWHIYEDEGGPVRAVVGGDRRLRLMLETPQMSLYEVVEW
jgi:hypothetical protein